MAYWALLEQLWTADEDRRSLRALADYFNRHLLEAALDAAGVQHLDGEIENAYRLLTNDDVNSADRTRVRRRLEHKQEGERPATPGPDGRRHRRETPATP